MTSNPQHPCAHCACEATGKYCPNCGHPQTLAPINGTYILTEFMRLFNMDAGLFYTIRALLLRPGESIRTYLYTDRTRLIKPLVFAIVGSLLYTLAQQLFHFEESYVPTDNPSNSTAIVFSNWIRKNYGYANLLMALFIVPWLKICFRRAAYNFFELVILLCYMIGMAMIMAAIVGSIDALLPWKSFQWGTLLILFYLSWGIGRFYTPHRKRNYFLALVAYLLGMITFFATTMLLGVAIDAFFPPAQ